MKLVANSLLFHIGSMMDLWGVSSSFNASDITYSPDTTGFITDASTIASYWSGVGADINIAMIADADGQKQTGT